MRAYIIISLGFLLSIAVIIVRGMRATYLSPAEIDHEFLPKIKTDMLM